MSIKNKYFLLPIVALGLSACSDDYYTPTYLTDKKMEVHQEGFEKTIDIAAVSDGAIAAIANDYKRYGGDVLNLTVSYNPSARGGYSASEAMREASDIAQKLRNDHYVKTIDVSILPVKDSTPKLYIDYTRYAAKGPADCDVAPGMDGEGANTEEHIENYKMGCSVKTIMAKQVYRPKDLLGTGPSESDADGRRLTNTLDASGYYDGAPNAPLENTESASEEE